MVGWGKCCVECVYDEWDGVGFLKVEYGVGYDYVVVV